MPKKNVTWELRDPQFLPFPHEDMLKNVLVEEFTDHVQGEPGYVYLRNLLNPKRMIVFRCD